jgi:hypothetical protein
LKQPGSFLISLTAGDLSSVDSSGSVLLTLNQGTTLLLQTESPVFNGPKIDRFHEWTLRVNSNRHPTHSKRTIQLTTPIYTIDISPQSTPVQTIEKPRAEPRGQRDESEKRMQRREAKGSCCEKTVRLANDPTRLCPLPPASFSIPRPGYWLSTEYLRYLTRELRFRY